MGYKHDRANVEMADGTSDRAGGGRQLRKRTKARRERHRAKANPECTPGYTKYRGYQL